MLDFRNNKSKELSDKKLFAKLGYKVDGILLECARDGTIINQWDYIGMWISSFNAGNFTMAGSNTPCQISATVTVDLIRRSNTDWNNDIKLVDLEGLSGATIDYD